MLVDSHCHLDFPNFAEDLPSVIARAKVAGVSRMVTISTRVAKARTYEALSEAHPEIWHTIGTHPDGAGDEPDVPTEAIVAHTHHPRCIGIGEADRCAAMGKQGRLIRLVSAGIDRQHRLDEANRLQHASQMIQQAIQVGDIAIAVRCGGKGDANAHGVIQIRDQGRSIGGGGPGTNSAARRMGRARHGPPRG